MTKAESENMATGFHTHCDLSRSEFIATTLFGNVPDFDLIVTDKWGFSCPIQAKTSRIGK